MQVRTHLAIDPRLVGSPAEIAEGTARVELATVAEMAADERGLVHGGFVFGLADYAAMLAVNEPNVVLGSSEVRFLRPVVTGERLVAEAAVEERAGKKIRVKATVRRADGDRGDVLSGTFVCFVPERHVLEGA
jgi:uncharacterized protein (TIGR00369 family)